MENRSNTGLCREQIFSDFFRKQSGPLRNFLMYKFGSEAVAEDITQEAFIRLWQNCADVPVGKAKSYIYTIARNASLNVIAHEKVKLSYKTQQPKGKQNIENPEFLLEEKQFRDQLLNAIQNLGEAQRVAFLMHRIDGKKYSEIADELGISVKAVEKRIGLALAELRNTFKNFR